MKKNIRNIAILLVSLSIIFIFIAYFFSNLKIIYWPTIGMAFSCGILGITLIIISNVKLNKSFIKKSTKKPDEFQTFLLNYSGRLAFWISDLTLFIFLFSLYIYVSSPVKLNIQFISIILFGYFILHNLVMLLVFLFVRHQFNE